jgi:hypothetical protein
VVTVKVDRVFCSRTYQAGCYGGGGERNAQKVEVKNVSQNGWSKASVALEGRRVPSHERGFQRGRGPWRRTAARAVLLPADRCSLSAAGGPRADALAGRERGHPRWLDPGGRCPAARPVDDHWLKIP